MCIRDRLTIQLQLLEQVYETYRLLQDAVCLKRQFEINCKLMDYQNDCFLKFQHDMVMLDVKKMFTATHLLASTMKKSITKNSETKPSEYLIALQSINQMIRTTVDVMNSFNGMAQYRIRNMVALKQKQEQTKALAVTINHR